MEWSDEDLYGLLSPPLHIPNSSEWSCEDNKVFENALAEMDPSSPTFFDNVAARIPWKTVEEIKLHFAALVNDVEMIESGNFPIPDYRPLDLYFEDDGEDDEDDDEDDDVEEIHEAPRGKRSQTKSGKQRRKGVPWTQEEHQLFLMGLNKYGKGDWRSISRYYVNTKTTTQVASHAQKYFRRRNSSTPPDRRRPSIHDIHTINPPAPSFTASPSLGLSSGALIPQLHYNFNCGGVPILHQNPTFFPLPINSSGYPVFNQTAPAANNYASSSGSPNLGC